MKPMKVFVSGPLTNDGTADTFEQINNMEAAARAGYQLIKKGHNPFVPHLSLYMGQLAAIEGTEITWRKWMDIDLAFLKHCDALLTLGSSRGADLERATALHLGIPVYDRIEDIPSVKGGD